MTRDREQEIREELRAACLELLAQRDAARQELTETEQARTEYFDVVLSLREYLGAQDKEPTQDAARRVVDGLTLAGASDRRRAEAAESARDAMQHRAEAAEADWQAAEEALSSLRVHLLKYGAHKLNCGQDAAGWNRANTDDGRCTCGFEAVLDKEVADADPPTEGPP